MKEIGVIGAARLKEQEQLRIDNRELKECLRELISCINEGSYNLSVVIKKCQSKL